MTQATVEPMEQNFRRFFDVIGDLIVVVALDGSILFANPAMEKKLGYSADELRKMKVLDLHPPSCRAEAAEIVAAMLRGERASCPLPLGTKAGGLYPVETRIWLGRWDGADCMFGVSKDLAAEQEAQQRFEQLFRRHPSMMAISDTSRRFIDVNNAFTTALGFSREEVLGHTVGELSLFADLAGQALSLIHI